MSKVPAFPSVPRVNFPHRLGRAAAILLVAGSLGACKLQKPDFSALASDPVGGSEEQLKRQAEDLGKAYDRAPGQKAVSLRYAQVLRMIGQHGQASAVLQKASLTNMNDREVRAAYGKVLAETGRFREAAEVLANAHSPDRPDWKILSAQGTVADQMGEHARAQDFYRAALKVAPGEPAILSNLGLSYALIRRLDEAERVLSEAASHPRADARVRANLALVLALSGKFKQSEEVARRDLPPGEAERNVQNVRQMISQNNSWAEIQKAELAKKKK